MVAKPPVMMDMVIRALREALTATRSIPDEGERSRALIFLAPHLTRDLVQEAVEQHVEQRRLLQVDAVAAHRQHRETRGANAALHEQIGLQRRLLLVAEHDQRRNVDRLHLGAVEGEAAIREGLTSLFPEHAAK